MPETKVRDISIHYETYGRGEPLVLIMGYGGHIGHWFHQIPGLSREYRLVAFDNRGTGRSDKPSGPYSMEQMADDTTGLLDALGIESAHIYGVSMGGCIAQQFALSYPERVQNLILGCTHSGMQHYIKLEDPAGRILHDFERIEQITPEQHEREYLEFLLSRKFMSNNKALVDQYLGKVTEYVTPLQTLKDQYEAILDFDSYGRLPEIKAPTLVICGDADKTVSPENSRQLAAGIPGAELVILEGVGHGFFLEAVEEANKAILEFLRRK